MVSALYACGCRVKVLMNQVTGLRIHLPLVSGKKSKLRIAEKMKVRKLDNHSVRLVFFWAISRNIFAGTSEKNSGMIPEKRNDS